MNPDQIAELKEVFSAFDKNAENKVPNENVKDIFCGLGYALTNGEIQSLLQEHTQRDGFTKFDEMCNIYAQHVLDFECMISVRMAFNLMDKELKGYVTPEDVVKFFQMIGESMTYEQATELVRGTSLFGYDKFNVVEFFIKSMREDTPMTAIEVEQIMTADEVKMVESADDGINQTMDEN
jgi:Ca2+-binding EF-hand superfamily protein